MTNSTIDTDINQTTIHWDDYISQGKKWISLGNELLQEIGKIEVFSTVTYINKNTSNMS